MKLSEASLGSGQKDKITILNSDFRSVDEYMDARPDASRAILGIVRNTIRKALPEADEVISYKMP